MGISLNLQRIGRVLGAIVVVLVLVGIVRASLEGFLDRGGIRDMFDRVSLDGESNIATWFSSAVLLGCAAILFVIWRDAVRRKDPVRKGWGMLALVFVALSIDEAAALHDQLSGPLKRALGAEGLLHYAWVIPGVLFTLAVFIACLNVLRSLPHLHRSRFILAGGLYITGALLLEMVSGAGKHAFGYGSWQYWLPTVIEETLELAGMCLFLTSLLHLASERLNPLSVRFASASSHEARAA